VRRRRRASAPSIARSGARVDRHLLARHRVQGEPRPHLRDALAPLGDHDELDDREDEEDDPADDVVAPHDELAEGSDHLAGVAWSRIRRVEETFSARRNSVVMAGGWGGRDLEGVADVEGDQEDDDEAARLPASRRSSRVVGRGTIISATMAMIRPPGRRRRRRGDALAAAAGA
jgi:hypothetical protein